VKPVVRIVVVIAAVLIVLIIAVPFLINVNKFRPQIESNLTASLGRPVTLGNLSLSVLSGSVEADQFTVADDPAFSSAPFIRAKTLQVGVELMPLLFSKQLNVSKLVIDQPAVNLLRNREGIWNFSSLGNKRAHPAQPASAEEISAPPANVNVDKLDLKNGTLTVGSLTGKRKPITYDKLTVSVRDFSFTTAFAVVVSARLPGGGSLKIDGHAGPIDSSDTSLTPLQAKVELKKLDLSQSALVDPELGVSGSADFSGTVDSNGSVAIAKGTLQARSLKLVPKGSPAAVPVQVVFEIDHDLKNVSGKIVQGDVAIGKATSKLTGTYEMKGETTSIQTRLDGLAMPVDDLEALLPALGVILPSGSKLKGGTFSVNLDTTGPLDRLVSTGSVRMTNASLAGFNLGSKLSGLSSLTGKQTGNDTTIKNLSSDVRHAPDGTRLDKIDVSIQSLGTVTGSGTISPDNALDFKLVANLAGAGGDLTKVAGFGSGGIPVSVGGTTSNPTFGPDMKAMATGKLKGLTAGKGNPLGSLGGLFGKKKSSQ
jgi:AsmA protein